jgi:hypothetical protein
MIEDCDAAVAVVATRQMPVLLLVMVKLVVLARALLVTRTYGLVVPHRDPGR